MSPEPEPESEPEPEAEQPEQAEQPESEQAEQPEALVEAEPAESCDPTDFGSCTEACSTRGCLEWCGGGGCLAAATELYACVVPALTKFEAANPEPSDGASEARIVDWDRARGDALGAHWSSTCQVLCEAAFVEGSPEAVEDVCDVAKREVHSWADLVAELGSKAEVQARHRAMVAKHGLLGGVGAGVGAGVGGAAGLFRVNRIVVDQEPLLDFDYSSELSELIASGVNLREMQGCVSFRGDDEKSFSFTVDFDAQGLAGPLRGEGSNAESECVGKRLRDQLRLPAAATRGLPEIRVIVHLHEERALDSGGMGQAEGWVIGAGTLGLKGTSRGGGSGEGTIGSAGKLEEGAGEGGAANVEKKEDADKL